MYRFEESKRVKPLQFKEVAPRFLSPNDFLRHFKDEIFQDTEATCEFEVVGVHDNTWLDLHQAEAFVIRKTYMKKFKTNLETVVEVKVKKAVKKRKRRWRSKSPFDKRRRRWVSPSTRRA